jgi:hypothetical protein
MHAGGGGRRWVTTFGLTLVCASIREAKLATMFVQSNDLFYAPREEGIALFASQSPATSPPRFCSGMRAPR